MEERLAAYNDFLLVASGEESPAATDRWRHMEKTTLEDAISGMLDVEQAARFEEIKVQHRQKRVEEKALKSFATLSTVVDLDPEQRDDVYQALADATRMDDGLFNEFFDTSREETRQNDDLDLLNTIRQQQRRLEESEGFSAESLNALSTSNREMVKQRIEERISLLTPHLTPEQLQQYRMHLETTGLGKTYSVRDEDAAMYDTPPGVPASED